VLYSVHDTDVGGGNLLTGCANGIAVGNGNGVRIHDVDVSGGGSGFGVSVSGSACRIVLERVVAGRRAVGVGLSGTVSSEMSDCEIGANSVGIRVQGSPDLAIHGCTIEENTTYGVQNDSAEAVDARGNWWGHGTGPTDTNPPNSLADGIGPNPLGQGDRVTDYVLYDPWTVPNVPPVADAGPDQTVEQTSSAGATVTLDASGSSDPDDDTLTYTWREGQDIIAGPTTEAHVDVTLNLGLHETELTVEDDSGATSTDTVVVVVVDTTAPDFTLTRLQTTLRPPNHQMVLCATVSDVSDICDAAPAVAIEVDSNEPLNGPGDGNTDPDWQVIDNGNVWEIWLRAERAGSMSARVYTVTATVTDASGRQTTKACVVTVPHDRRRK